MAPRTRLKPDERRAQILNAAAREVVEQGCLPVSLDALAKRLAISKALIYAYFPTQHALVNGLLEEHYPAVAERQMETLHASSDFDEAARDCAGAYFDHVAEVGPLLHILMSDLYAQGQIDPAILALQRRVFSAHADGLRRLTSLDSKRSLASVRMFAALVEEAGTLAFQGFYERAFARETCIELVSGGLDALRAAFRPGGPQRRGARN